LGAQRFEQFLIRNPHIDRIELSNWGEVMLNRELPELLRIAWRRKVALHADNGANLNHLSEAILQAIVGYRLRSLTCSIDGTTQETYERYRRGGNLARVLDNIERINALKARYRTRLPRLQWQFVVFEHNAHEVEQARLWARQLNMSFRAKSNWDDLYGQSDPALLQQSDKVRAALGYQDRPEYARQTGRHTLRGVCRQLWQDPQINFDGRLLGCCVNHWSDFGNVFEQGLQAVFAGESLEYARQMLRGQKSEREDIACTQCSVYHHLKENGNWLTEAEVSSQGSAWRRWLKRHIHPDVWEWLRGLFSAKS